jgi:type IV secretion system protein VirD4
VSATKILWGQISIVVLIVLATIWAATQWTAWRLGFQPQLGQLWLQIVPGMPVYLPPAFFWWYAYDVYAPSIFLEGASIAASGGLLSLVVAVGMSVWRARETRSIETYGSAPWATPREVKRAGLLGPDGVVLGRYRRAYLRHDGPEHVLCFGPTRSGKGVTAMSFLGLYRDPVVAQVTRRCDWRIIDLIAGDRPATLYLVVPPSDISRTKPLVRLLLNQIGRRLTE